MRAAFYECTGPAHEVLQLGEVPDPKPAPGEVLVEIHASGINPADVKRRGGWLSADMDHPQVIPHSDGAGMIVAVGGGVDPQRVGSHVWLWNAQGGYGEPGRAFGTAARFTAIPSEQAVPLPESLDMAAGACLGVPAMTAYATVFTDGDIAGQTVLVQGAGGAVGHFAVQLAHLAGAHVIATAGRPETIEHAKQAGADTVLNRHDPNIAAQILAHAEQDGVDRIIEVDFGANLPVTTKVLKNAGIVASYSSTSMPEPTLPYYAFAGRGAAIHFVQGFRLRPDLRTAGQAYVADLAGKGLLRVAVGERFPLERIVGAHETVERGDGVGNTVLEIK